MALYDYKCPKCGVEREVVKSIKDDSPAFCIQIEQDDPVVPRLCNTPMERVFKPGSVLLKGLDNTKG